MVATIFRVISVAVVVKAAAMPSLKSTPGYAALARPIP